MSDLGLGDKNINDMAGHKIRDLGYMSMSCTKWVAEEFAFGGQRSTGRHTEDTDPGVLFRIRIPRHANVGSLGAALSRHLDDPGPLHRIGGIMAGQHELLAARGHALKITGVRKERDEDNERDEYHVDADLVPRWED
jgi:hypothetical protein